MKRRPYRHLLAPTDGSVLAARGVRAAAALAAALGAKLRGVYVLPSDSVVLEGAGSLYGASVLLDHLEKDRSARARKALAQVRSAARRAGVPCVVEAVEGRQPWKEILGVARRRRCDLVVLASRTRSRVGGALFSQAAKLLSSAKVAVLVVR